MGGSSGRSRVLFDAFFIIRPFDTKIITAGLCIPHVDVGYLAIPEQTAKLGLDGAVGNIPLRDQSPACRIGVESKLAGMQLRRKSPVLRIPLALVLMDENGNRQRKPLLSVE